MLSFLIEWWWVLAIVFVLIVPEVIFKLTGRVRRTLSVWWWDAFAIRGFLHDVDDPKIHHPQTHVFLRRAIAGALWAGVTLHFFFLASYWPIIIYGAPAACSVYYYYRYER